MIEAGLTHPEWRAAVAPVEYAVAVEEYLGQAVLGAASRRVENVSSLIGGEF